ncbi:hypothetical protein TNCV_3130541 [Trichonephila clavipes]|nr:hypothetical protein TNCV_3130541 [Trichonephila clavipes]
MIDVESRVLALGMLKPRRIGRMMNSKSVGLNYSHSRGQDRKLFVTVNILNAVGVRQVKSVKSRPRRVRMVRGLEGLLTKETLAQYP